MRSFKTCMYGVLSISFMLLMHGCATATPKSGDILVGSGIEYKIYKDKKQHFYVVQDGKIVYHNLHYAINLGNSVLTLDAKNKVKILKLKEHKRSKQTNDENELPPLMCGNSEFTHNLTIEKKNDYLDLMVRVSISGDVKHIVQKNRIVSIPRAKVDSIFFAGNRSNEEIDSDENIGPVYLYFQKGSHYGFLGKIDSAYKNEKFIYTFVKSKYQMLYDSMEIDEYNNNVLLSKNGLYGYYLRGDDRMIATKYKSFQSYKSMEKVTKGYLARFELPDGRKGYVDTKGNEYYD